MVHMNTTEHVADVVDSPVGKLTLVASGIGLSAILWENDRPGRVRVNISAWDAKHPILQLTNIQLREYFDGERKEFDIPFDPIGTLFQRSVWDALSTIPFGETRSYAQIARQIGAPKAVRAVGAANGRNPLSIVVPCHRVIGSSGTLTGFAGGLDRKLLLLDLEEPVDTEAPTLFDGLKQEKRLLRRGALSTLGNQN